MLGRGKRRNISVKRGKLVSRDKEHLNNVSQCNNQNSFKTLHQTENEGYINCTLNCRTSTTEKRCKKQAFEADMEEQRVASSVLKPNIRASGQHITWFLQDLKNLQNNTIAQANTSRDTCIEELESEVINRCHQFISDVHRYKTITSLNEDISSGKQCSCKCSKMKSSNDHLSHEYEEDSVPSETVHNERESFNEESFGSLCRGREKQEISLMNILKNAEKENSKDCMTHSEDHIKEIEKTTQFSPDNLYDGSHGWDANDMFDRNKELFGVTSSYSPDMDGYTTLLKRENTPEWREKEREAERMAKLISSSSHFQQYEEAENRDEENILYGEEQKNITKRGHSYNLYENDIDENQIKELQLTTKIKPALEKISRKIANQKKLETVGSAKQFVPKQAHVLTQGTGSTTFVSRHNKGEYTTRNSNQMQGNDLIAFDPANLSSSLISLTASTLSIQSSLSNVLPTLKPAKMTALSLDEDVEITHIVNPSLFYIFSKSNAYKREKLEAFIKHSALEAEHVSNPQIGKVYLGQYTRDNRWYRAVVITKGTKKDEYQIKYVDYGNAETINKIRLRECPDKYNLKSIPSFCFSCGLWEIIPARGSTWDSEAKTTFYDLVEGVNLQLFVINKSEGPSEPLYQIELRRPVTTPGIANTVPSSIREVMVFLELAVYVNESQDGAFDQMATLWKRKYFKQEIPFGEEDCPVELGYMESPGCMYLHLKRFSEDRQKLKQQIQSHYNSAKVRASKDWNMLVPKVGMPCIAKYSQDDNWYRAEIKDIPGNKMVDVFYTDFGNKERLWYKQIRRIHEDFLRLPAQAIECHIYDVKWDKNLQKEILDSFLLLVEGKNLYANFHTVVNDSCSVSLIAVSEETNSIIDIGLYLIDSDYAETEKIQDKMCSSTLNIDRNCNDMYLPRKKTNRHTTEFYDPCFKISSFPVSDAPKNKRKNVIFVEMTDNFIHLQYKSYFHKFQDIQARLENEMQLAPAEIATFTPKEGKVCVLSVDHKPYYARVRILRIKKDKAMVHLIDCGGIEESSLSHLVPMPAKFQEEKGLAVIVSLKDLKAPGGKAKWPLSALDFMKSFINNYRDSLYIVRKDATYTGPIYDLPVLPVEMGWEIEELGGPITPSVIKPISLNQLLVQEGYALRERFAYDSLREDHWREMGNKSFTQSTLTLTNDFHSSLECSPIHSDSTPDLTERQDPIGDTNPFCCMLNEEDNCIKQWLPAVLPKSSVFTAIPTYVDNEGKIYINLLTDIKMLEMINDSQTMQYQETKPSDADFYKIGDPVIAKFHLDEHWYRATVLSKENSVTIVKFVDYGNPEEVEVGGIRKGIIYKNQPIMCHRCILDGIVPIHPEGRWSRDALDQLHKKIVNSECRIQVVRPASLGEDLYIKLHVINSKDHKDIGDWLVDAMKVCKRVFKAETHNFKVNASHCYKGSQNNDVSLDEESCDVVIEESSQSISLYDESVGNTLSFDEIYPDHENVGEYYKTFEVNLSIPLLEMNLPIDEVFPVEIISIVSEQQMFIRPKQPLSYDSYPSLKPIMENKKRYEKDFTNSNPLMCSAISHPKVGEIYMATKDYGEKGLYRVHVLEDKGNNVEVLFVDQGIKKVIPKKSLRMCGHQYSRHPLQCAKASIYVKDKKVHYYWSEHAFREIVPKNPLSGFYAKVKGKDDEGIIEVQLLSPRDYSEPYEDFIGNRYLIKAEKKIK